ncbi:MAG: RnfABCDGE type electron transport complex subunit A [Lachnospiraceae bacterium]|nr:RnfABCDGE type electron transport complex subunit A [Lachnospiraceae bacterium]
MSFEGLIIIMVSAAIVNNLVLIQFLGICPFLGVSKDMKSATGMGLAVLFVMFFATLVTWPIQMFLLEPNGLGYLQTIVFVLIIAALVQFIEIVLKRYIPALHVSLGVYLPLMTTNCALFAVTLMNVQKGYSLIESVVNSVGAGLGFLLAMTLFSAIRKHIENSDPPECFKGAPLTLIAAAILSISFFGFSGVIENLFG